MLAVLMFLHYPVHDFYPVILVGMVIVLQGLELALHHFLCSKLRNRAIFKYATLRF
jgi:hypothetical protein